MAFRPKHHTGQPVSFGSPFFGHFSRRLAIIAVRCPENYQKFNWSAVNPIRYVAGSLYLIAKTEHRDEPRGGGGGLWYICLMIEERRMLLSSAFKATAYKGFLLKGHLKHTEQQARNVETAEFAQR